VVVLDPTTGAVLASYANPTFDPNPLSSHDTAEINEAWAPLRDDPDRPLVDRATAELYPPGSAFKVIVTAAALEAGSDPSRTFPNEVTYDVPQTSQDISNAGDVPCGDGDEVTLQTAFRRSCNTVFARLGVELGAEALADQAEAFGFNLTPPLELPVAVSSIPPDQDVPATAQSAIGQRDVRATVLQMAMVAATVANGGQLLRPTWSRPSARPTARCCGAGHRTMGGPTGRWATHLPAHRAATAQPDDRRRHRSGSHGQRCRHLWDRGGWQDRHRPDGPRSAAGRMVRRLRGDGVAVAVAVPDAEGGGGAIAAPVARAVMIAATGE
jgi:penicillin-binding protein A